MAFGVLEARVLFYMGREFSTISVLEGWVVVIQVSGGVAHAQVVVVNFLLVAFRVHFAGDVCAAIRGGVV